MHDQIETIESGYEYLLAYAAQGKDTDETGGDAASEVRTRLTAMAEAASSISSSLDGDDRTFGWVILDDARKAHAAISLVLEQKGISSEMVDNLNASIHLRALLTDLFLLSEAASPPHA
ncbi:MAG: hypothetical protein GXP15_05365 [Gammaproteobacteria bacterium]|nr:hypothetical protein [Gammaproteobacteria bacterium]